MPPLGWRSTAPTSTGRTPPTPRSARADLDGTNVNQNFITGASAPIGVAVDGAHVYWTNTATSTIGRADLGGTNVNQSFITGASSPLGWRSTVPTSTGRIGNGTIGRADLGGTNVNQSFITGAS